MIPEIQACQNMSMKIPQHTFTQNKCRTHFAFRVLFSDFIHACALTPSLTHINISTESIFVLALSAQAER